MANWELTKGLQNLRAQVNAAFPDRDRTSDGTIGDAAHQAETSGHNPDDTPGSRPEWNGDDDANAEVRAWDMDSDLRFPGVTAQDVVDHIRDLPNLSSVLRYMIYNRRIYRASTGWAPEEYTGPSPHTEHIHFSGAFTQAADSNTTYDYRLNELTGGDEMLVKKGDSGEEVKFWQMILNDVDGAGLTVDGDYGSATESAVNASRAKRGQGPNPATSGWHAFVLLRGLATKYAGKDGAPGAPGKDGQLSGTLNITGGHLEVTAP